jgi:hypothetical protein
MAIILVLFGILVGGVTLKGLSLIESANMQRVQKQIEEYRGAVLQFKSQFGAIPGTYANLSAQFGKGAENGTGAIDLTGKGLEAKSDQALVWKQLIASGILRPIGNLSKSGVTCPKSALGGVFTLSQTADPSGLWLVLGAEKGDSGQGPLLSPELAKRLGESLGVIGEDVLLLGEEGKPDESCAKGLGKEKKCIVQILICP